MLTPQRSSGDNTAAAGDGGQVRPPAISLPKGGGAIRGIGEKFAANPVTGTGSMTVPIATSPGRSGFGPQLSLSYDSGSGNGPFGFGWNLSLPSITRKTDKGLPQYRDAEESDVFILSGAEDLVPALVEVGGQWQREPPLPRTVGGGEYRIQRYQPRIEGLFARIERWTSLQTGETHWRSITRDNITTLYGKDNNSRIFDPHDPHPEHPTRIFSWLICASYDDKGNVTVYEYNTENAQGVEVSFVHERNRADLTRSANRYLKRIKYGNRRPNRDSAWQPTDPTLLDDREWMFEVIFDYGEGHASDLPLDPTRSEAAQHRFVTAQANAVSPWPVRQDPFSSYRAGFELRTYRLCRRVLMFHHFPEELGIADYLVRSTDFTYAASPIASFITSVTQSGYVHQPTPTQPNRYLKQSLPPLEFEYSQADIDDTVQEIDSESLENLPYGLDGANYQWVDLDGEGISGILTEQADGWFYKRNLSPAQRVRDNGSEHTLARFAPVELVTAKPNTSLASGQAQFMDLAGDGQVDLVQLDAPVRGFYERTDDADWVTFRPFTACPNLDMRDPNLRFIDLDGDGHTDILVTEDEAFSWHASLAEQGFGPAVRVYKPDDEEKGPRLVFADGTQSIYLADVSGDGLTDLVRIRNGEVCYWPNLGYGRFGAKVTMDKSPWFEPPDLFDQRRVRLGDIDGSGTTDIFYLGRDGITIWRNQSGNSWSAPKCLSILPPTDSLSSVTVVDLLGNGTACLVWSSPLPGDTSRHMRYVDLMGGQKPHLLIKVVNNLGAETRVHYSPSTTFYVADKLAGKPWITRLPFPVHVIERVEIYDHISRNRFVTRYAYHHGYFDGEEREFRGFGMVEQFDTEEFAVLSASDTFPVGDNIDQTSHIPPVLTRTWFHTGAYIEGGRISRQFENDYYREGDPSLGEAGLSDDQLRAMLLDDTRMPDAVLMPDGRYRALIPSPDEVREACRALKGSILRQEIYAQDSSEEQDRPYSVSERNYTLEWIQPREGQRHAVFFAHPRETIDFHYERKLFDVDVGGQTKRLADPRVSHAMTLAVDYFGNVLQSVAIGYGRRHDDPDPVLTEADRSTQPQPLITYTENRFTISVEEQDDYRTPLPCETRTYELLNVRPDSNAPLVTNLFRLEEMRAKIQAASDGQHEIPYEDIDATSVVNNAPHRRLIEHMRALFRRNNLTGPLPLEELESLALPYEQYRLALTQGLAQQLYVDSGKLGANALNAVLADEGKYVHSEGDTDWWIPSGRMFYSPDSTDTAARELAYAHQHFFLPHRYRDPFHTDAISTESIVTYDAYDLLLVETRDALGNRVTVGERDTAGNLVIPGDDYRMLRPRLMMDPNRNRAAVAFDALGMVVGTVVMGKPPPAPVEGDSLDGFEADLTEAVMLDHLAHPMSDPQAILTRATTRLVYDLFAYHRTKDQLDPQPAVVYTLARETHDSDPVPAGGLKIQHSFSFSDGFGRAIQKKMQAEVGPLVEGGPEVSPRWVGGGWTIFNNKGKPVRKYEPFFTNTHRFEFARIVGVSPILFYDPVERVVATLHPNHAWEKVVFDPWRQENWDVNDTVLVADPKTDPDVGDFFRRLSETDYLPPWHAQRQGGVLGMQEQGAAGKAALHAETPTVAHVDSLGRTVLTVAHNRFKYSDTPPADPPTEEFYPTRVSYDIEGNQREVRDAIVQAGDPLGRIVMRYEYDMLGNRVHQASMEAGERWMLNDVAGSALYSWNSRNHRLRIAYDPLRRPIETYLRLGAGAELLVERTVYGETRPNPEANNVRGQVVQVFDQAGVVMTDDYDLKGNLLSSRRQLAQEYKTTLDWSAAVPLEAATYTNRTRYDALNRPTEMIYPDNSVIHPGYNEANLLERVEANRRGAGIATPFVTDIDYNAKGQRERIEYGNGVVTTYEYDPLSFRLIHLQTLRGAERLQDLSYTYDPVSNITHIRDDAQQTIYFRNQRVEPSAEYTYDAIYRLIEATGREHLGQIAGAPNPHSYNDAPRVGLLHPGDGNAMGTYLERYVYDAVGNILQMEHRAGDPAHSGWTRTYGYDEASLIEPAKQSNRLSSTAVGSGRLESYLYDAHGNMTRMNHLPLMQWDYRDQLQATAQQVINNGTPETTWYVYDASGQRVRKVTELATGQIKDERIYLGGFEVYRRQGVNAVVRETLHIMDDKQRIALVETRTRGNEPGVPAQLIRYQIGNHLGSASLELDDQAQIISYEECYPYGSTSYQAVHSQSETPKRFRYTGKERDEKTGFYYHGKRYYTPWLGRWTRCDPAGMVDGPNLYRYVRDNPVLFSDPTATAAEDETLKARFVRIRETAFEALKEGNITRRQELLTQAANQIGKEILQPIDAELARIKTEKAEFKGAVTLTKTQEEEAALSLPKAKSGQGRLSLPDPEGADEQVSRQSRPRKRDAGSKAAQRPGEQGRGRTGELLDQERDLKRLRREIEAFQKELRAAAKKSTLSREVRQRFESFRKNLSGGKLNPLASIGSIGLTLLLGSLADTPVADEGYSYVPYYPIDPHLEAITPYRETPEVSAAIGAAIGRAGGPLGTLLGGIAGALLPSALRGLRASYQESLSDWTQEWERKLGRPLTPEEHGDLARRLFDPRH